VIFIVKALISGVLVALVNLIAQRNPTLAGFVVAFPVITLLSVLWLWLDRVPEATMDAFLLAVVWGLVPTFIFALALIAAFRLGLPLLGAIAAGAIAWTICTALLQRVGSPQL
jgi:hypothetical protein